MRDPRASAVVTGVTVMSSENAEYYNAIVDFEGTDGNMYRNIAIYNIPFKVAVLVIYIALCWFVFTLLPTGREARFIGGNPVCAKLSGIDEKKLAVIASLISAVGIGLGAFLTIVYAPTLNKDTASSIGMDVIIAIVFGGMPVSGGPRSRILSAVVGAFSMGFLSQIMTMLNLGSGYGQIIKAAIFLLVVFIALGSQRGKLLTR